MTYSVRPLAPLAAPAGAVASGAWQLLPIVGGGFNTRIVAGSDGTLFTGVDVQGAYVRSNAPAGQDTWIQRQTATGLPADYAPTPYAAGGAFEIAIDPSNPNNLLLFTGPSGRTLTTLLRSTDKGRTWAHTNYGFTNDEPNQSGSTGVYDYHLNGNRIAIDPNNPNVWYVGNGAGMKITRDAGVTWSTAPVSFPGSAGALGICVDGNSGTTTVGGVTVSTTIWAASFGNGVYKSTDGGVTWALITGSPTNVGHAKLASDGAYYCTPTLGALNFFRIIGTTVTTITIGGNGCMSIAIDPVNPGRLIGVSPYNGVIITLAGAANAAGTPTATAGTPGNSISNDAPWMDISNSLGNSGVAGWSSADVVWDPLVTTSSNTLTIANVGTLGPFTVGTNQNIWVGDTLRVTNTGTFTNYMLGTVTAYNPATGSITLALGVDEGAGQYLGGKSGGAGTFSAWTITKERIWVANGVGVCYIDAPTTATNTIVDASLGIENLVALCCDVWPPNAPPVLSAADKAVWYIQNNPLTATMGQAGYGFNNDAGVVEWNFIAYAVGAPSILVGSTVATAAKSTSGGVVGTAANGNTTSWSNFANQPSALITCWAAATALNYVVVRGSSMSYTLDGGVNWLTPTGNPTAFLGGPFESIQPLCADSVNIGTFYCYSGSTCYKSVNGGANWSAGYALLTQGNFPKLKNPYGQAGHLFFTSGNIGFPTGNVANLAALNALHPVAGQFLFFSSNGGGSFAPLQNVLEVIDIAFSAPAPGQSYNSILINGWVSVSGTYTYGWWRCDNFNPANAGAGLEVWTFLGAYPFNWYDTPVGAGGNPSRYNQWIMGCQGSSFKIFGSPSTPWP